MKRDRTPISRGAQHAAGLGCPRDDPPPPQAVRVPESSLGCWGQDGTVRDSLPRGAVSHGDSAHAPILEARPCAYVCVCVCMHASGVGTVSFSCLSGAGEGWRHCLPAPHEDASLAAAILFCFCHIVRGFSHPLPLPRFVRLPVCHLFINFVLREQMAGAESGRMCLPPPPSDSPLEHAARTGSRLPCVWNSQTKTDF